MLKKCVILLFALFYSASVLARGVVAPELASVAAIAMDIDSGELLASKHAHVPLPIASITKLMTAVVVLDSEANLDEWLEVHDWAERSGKNAYSRIRLGSQAKRQDLLRIALMSSENRAAYNLAVNHPGGYEAFLSAMNEKAAELGMKHTNFVDPTGLSPDNQAAAHDLGLLLAAAYKYATIRQFSTTQVHTVNFRAPRYKLNYGNTNPLANSSRWDVSVSKTGYLTEAGRCLVMVTSVDDREVAMVMLNSFGKRSPLGDAGRMKRYIQSGERGRVAQAARRYEQDTANALGLTASDES